MLLIPTIVGNADTLCVHVSGPGFFKGPELRSKIVAFLKPYSRVVVIHTTAFSGKKLFILPTQCNYMFHRLIRTNSDYFH